MPNYEDVAKEIVAKFCDGTLYQPDMTHWRFIEWFGDPPTLTPKDIVDDIVKAQQDAYNSGAGKS